MLVVLKDRVERKSFTWQSFKLSSWAVNFLWTVMWSEVSIYKAIG